MVKLQKCGSNGMLEVGHNTTYIYQYTHDNTKNTITTTPKPSPNFYFLCFLTEPKTILFISKIRAYFPDTHPDQDQNSHSDRTSLYLPASQDYEQGICPSLD